MAGASIDEMEEDVGGKLRLVSFTRGLGVFFTPGARSEESTAACCGRLCKHQGWPAYFVPAVKGGCLRGDQGRYTHLMPAM